MLDDAGTFRQQSGEKAPSCVPTRTLLAYGFPFSQRGGKEMKVEPILWAGPFTDPTGYGEEARALLVACERSGLPIACEEWPGMRETVQLSTYQHLVWRKARERVPKEPYVNVWHKTPPQIMRAALSGVGPTVIRTMFETDAVPAYWLPGLSRVDEVWVPSHFNYETFAAGGVPREKLRILPQTLDFSLFDPEVTEPLARPQAARRFCFLSVLEFASCKGWDILIDSWCRAFAPDDDVCLILKTTRHLETSAAVEDDLERYIAGRACAPIIYDTRTLPQAEMPRLYAACDAYVIPSRGEGWGRSYMEALAMGLPTIASHWGGSMEFATEDICFLAQGEVRPVPLREPERRFRGMRWFEPDKEHLTELLQTVFRGGDKVEEKRARSRERLLSRFSEQKVAEQAVALANESVAHWSTPRRPRRYFEARNT